MLVDVKHHSQHRPADYQPDQHRNPRPPELNGHMGTDRQGSKRGGKDEGKHKFLFLLHLPACPNQRKKRGNGRGHADGAQNLMQSQKDLCLIQIVIDIEAVDKHQQDL